MFSLKSALTWGIGLALGVALVASLQPGIRDQISQALVKTEALVESSLGLAEQESASVSTGSPADVETGTELQTGVQAQTGVGVNAGAGNTSTTIGTEVGAQVNRDWSLKSLFYKLTHSSYGLNVGLNAQAEAEADAEANP